MPVTGAHQPALQSIKDRYSTVSWHHEPRCRLEVMSGLLMCSRVICSAFGRH